MAWEVRFHGNGTTYLVYDNEGWYVMSCQNRQRAQLVAHAPQMLEALEAIVALKPPGWCDLGEVLDVYHQHKKIARVAIAAVKGE